MAREQSDVEMSAKDGKSSSWIERYKAIVIVAAILWSVILVVVGWGLNHFFGPKTAPQIAPLLHPHPLPVAPPQFKKMFEEGRPLTDAQFIQSLYTRDENENAGYYYDTIDLKNGEQLRELYNGSFRATKWLIDYIRHAAKNLTVDGVESILNASKANQNFNFDSEIVALIRKKDKGPCANVAAQLYPILARFARDIFDGLKIHGTTFKIPIKVYIGKNLKDSISKLLAAIPEEEKYENAALLIWRLWDHIRMNPWFNVLEKFVPSADILHELIANDHVDIDPSKDAIVVENVHLATYYLLDQLNEMNDLNQLIDHLKGIKL